MPKINCLVIVLGYDHNLTEKYKHYLHLATEMIKKNRAEVVLTTGSYEGKHEGYTDEAAFIKDYFLRHKISAEIIADPLGITTLQNLKNAKKMVAEREIQPEKIIICCEGIRLFKVKVLGYLIFKRKLEFVYWGLIEKRRDIFYEKFWNTPRDILGFFLPFLERRKIAKRQGLKK
jgi:hypothetical protein